MTYECEADTGRPGCRKPGRCRLRGLRRQGNCQALAAWRSGGGAAGMNSITADLTKLETAASAQSMTALASAGDALDGDAANAALDLPPIDSSDWINAMADFQLAGTQFSTGIQANAKAGETPLKTAVGEFKSFGASVKATCN